MPRRRVLPGGFATKLAAGFLFVLLLLGGSAVASLQRLARASDQRAEMLNRYHDDALYAERLRATADGAALAGRTFLFTRDPGYLEQVDEARSAFSRALADLGPRVVSPTGLELLEDLKRTAADYEQAQRRLLVESSTGRDPVELERLLEEEVEPVRLVLSARIDAFIAYKERLLEAGHEEARADSSRAVSLSLAGVALAVIASALFAWAMGRHLTRAYAREREAVRVAERALAARDELLGIVAHDLRSPLSAIVLNAGLIERTSAVERTRRHASSIRSVGSRMEHLIQSLLDAASIEAGRYTITRAPCEVEALLDGALEVVGSLASAKSIRLSVQVEEPGLRVLADRERVIRVLTNLIGNSLKFGREGGRVTVTARRIGPEVGLSVEDDGPGISPEHLPHVFERFWKSETGGQRGTGLGLFIARAIVEAHGGRIRASSTPGRGATFEFTLPLTEGLPSPGPEGRAGRLAAERAPETHP